MTKTDPGHIQYLDEKQLQSLRSFWLALIAEINEDPEQFVRSDPGDEFFFLCARDNPDSIALRWLRARQWNVSSAVQMMLTTLRWRKEFNVKKLLKNGEKDLLEEEMRTNKTYHMGDDRQGHPVTYVHASEHVKGQFPFEYTEKFVVLNMEVGRYVSKNGIEQGTVVLDMSNVKYQNLDYQHIRFMVDAMQNSYPECLSQALIVNAPWGFGTVWNIVRLWLDPIVAQKIHFLKTSKDLSEHIDPQWIPKRLDGNHPDFHFTPANEQDKAKIKLIRNDQQRYEQLRQAHQLAAKNYLELTFKWAKTAKENEQPLATQRHHTQKILAEAFEHLLPFVFTETVYHRQGLIELPIYDLTSQQLLDDQEQTTQF